MKDKHTEMIGVIEYSEGMGVELIDKVNGDIIIRGWNEGGYNCVDIDLKELIIWIKTNRTELLMDKNDK